MRDFWVRASRAARRFMLGPKVQIERGLPTVRLGSTYGGWVFVDTPDLIGSTIVSCGLGEDASFDVEFASRYDSRVILFDPTPRAIAHFHSIDARLGQPARSSYDPTGSQSVESYDLEFIKPGQLVLHAVAVTTEDGPVRFYAPRNPNSVSHSIVNFQNGYSTETPYIEVKGISARSLAKHLGDITPSLVKLDIEGAEIVVIPALLEAGLAPKQLLVEFDELNYPSRQSRAHFESVDRLLIMHGYVRVYWDGRSCVSYLRRDST